MAYLDALMLAEMPSDFEALLPDSDRPAFKSAFKEVKRILTGGKLPWRTIRQLLTQNGSVVASPSDAFDPGAAWADYRMELPKVPKAFLLLLAKAWDRLLELRGDLDAAPPRQREAVERVTESRTAFAEV